MTCKSRKVRQLADLLFNSGLSFIPENVITNTHCRARAGTQSIQIKLNRRQDWGLDRIYTFITAAYLVGSTLFRGPYR